MARACSSRSVPATPERAIRYPVSDVALRHEAGVSEPATSGKQAYVGAPETTPGPAPEGLFADR